MSGSRRSASEPPNPGSALPVNDVGQEVVVPEPVVDVHLVVVDRQGSIDDAPLLKSRVGFTTEHRKRHTSHLRHSITGPSYRYFKLPSLLTCESIELVSTYFLSNTHTHCVEAQLEIRDSKWHKKLGWQTGRRSSLIL